MGNEKYLNWEFNALTPSDYEIPIEMHTDSRMIKTLFAKARGNLIRKKGINVEGNVDLIKAFDITPDYFPYMKIILKKIVNKIFREIKEDKIEVIDYKVTSGKFVKNDKTNLWDIKIIIGGVYADKR